MSRWRVVILILILVLISAGSAFGLTGCWDAREIDRRAFIFAMGIDLEANGLYRVSAIAVRGSSPSAGISAGSGVTGDMAAKVPVLVAQGRTVAEAMDALAANSARNIDWGNLRSIILGEMLSQNGVNAVVRTALADPRTPADVILFQAQGSAEAIVRSRPEGEEHLQAWLDHYRSKANPETPAQFFVPAWQFRSHLINPGQDAFLGTIALRDQEDPQPTLSGIAVFKDDRLRGFLNEDQTTDFSWMSGKTGGLVVVGNPHVPDQMIPVRIIALRRDLAISASKSTVPVLSIKIRATGAINNTGDISELASLAAARIKKQIATTALIMQKEFSADLLGFGELARRSAPYEWQPDTWENQWNQATWNITVEVSLQASGRYQ